MYHRPVQERSGRGAARGGLACAIASLVLLTAPCARATDAEAPAPSMSAQQLADQAYELHEAGRYLEAIAMYLKVYELSNVGVALLNVGTIYDRKLHERGPAIEFYRRYVNGPDADRDLARKTNARIAALKLEEVPLSPAGPTDPIAAHLADPTESHGTEAAASHENAVAAVPLQAASAQRLPPSLLAPRNPEVPPEHHEWRTAGIVLTVTGAASIGASLTLGLLAKLKNDDANGVCNGSVCPTSDGVNLAHQAGSLATAATATFFGGLALAGGGAVMIALAPHDGARPTHLAIAPRVGASGAGLILAGDFRGP
jgi:hypothetical protein